MDRPLRPAGLPRHRVGHVALRHGHAFGGAIAEILPDRGLGAAGVAIDAVAVRGILATSGSADRAPLLHIAGTVVGPGWEEVADYALRRAVENGTGNARMVP